MLLVVFAVSCKISAVSCPKWEGTYVGYDRAVAHYINVIFDYENNRLSRFVHTTYSIPDTVVNDGDDRRSCGSYPTAGGAYCRHCGSLKYHY